MHSVQFCYNLHHFLQVCKKNISKTNCGSLYENSASLYEKWIRYQRLLVHLILFKFVKVTPSWVQVHSKGLKNKIGIWWHVTLSPTYDDKIDKIRYLWVFVEFWKILNKDSKSVTVFPERWLWAAHYVKIIFRHHTWYVVKIHSERVNNEKYI